jgi:hypothetical protein
MPLHRPNARDPTGAPLPRRNVDHQLTGEWQDHRDCHLRPDLVLIYRLPGADILELVRLGSHSELGLQAAFLPAYQRHPPKSPGTADTVLHALLHDDRDFEPMAAHLGLRMVPV